MRTTKTRRKPIKVPGAPLASGQCTVRPPLDGSKGNPMAFCTKPAGHKGKHSWE